MSKKNIKKSIVRNHTALLPVANCQKWVKSSGKETVKCLYPMVAIKF